MSLIRLITILTLLSFLWTSCATAHNKKVKKLRVTHHIEFFFTDEIKNSSDVTFEVNYQNNLTLYKFEYQQTLMKYPNIIVLDTIRNYFFTIEKGAKKGYLFDPYHPVNTGWFSIDSILRQSALQDFNWEQIAALTPVSNYNANTGILEEIYSSNETDPIKDTLKFYFSDRFRDYDFSFSKKLDSLKKKKLFKIVVYNGPYYHEGLKKDLPERRSYFMMEEGKLDDLAVIEKYFNEYRRMKEKK